MKNDMVQRIRALQKELHEVLLYLYPAWDEQSSDEETEKYLRRLERLKIEKDKDSRIWQKMVRGD